MIVKDLKETDDLCNSLLLMMGGSSMMSSDSDSESLLKAICSEILTKMPKKFDLELVLAKYPT
jgi:hypothetical protein